jgi:hypothetical protein
MFHMFLMFRVLKMSVLGKKSEKVGERKNVARYVPACVYVPVFQKTHI